MYADSKYHNFQLDEWVDEYAKWDPKIIRYPEGKRGWVRLPIRWTVERTFAWLGRCRRLSKVREKSVLLSESFIKLAMIHRLELSDVDPEFRSPRPVAA
jgi:putative transposase